MKSAFCRNVSREGKEYLIIDGETVLKKDFLNWCDKNLVTSESPFITQGQVDAWANRPDAKPNPERYPCCNALRGQSHSEFCEHSISDKKFQDWEDSCENV